MPYQFFGEVEERVKRENMLVSCMRYKLGTWIKRQDAVKKREEKGDRYNLYILLGRLCLVLCLNEVEGIDTSYRYNLLGVPLVLMVAM